MLVNFAQSLFSSLRYEFAFVVVLLVARVVINAVQARQETNASAQHLQTKLTSPPQEVRVPKFDVAPLVQPLVASVRPKPDGLRFRRPSLSVENCREALSRATSTVAVVGELCRAQIAQAADTYRELVRAVDIVATADAAAPLDVFAANGVRVEELEVMFQHLIVAHIRVGKAPVLERTLLADMGRLRVPVSVAVLEAAVKVCTAKHHFQDARHLFKALSRTAQRTEIPLDVSTSVHSCLLYCAVEVEDAEAAQTHFAALKEAGKPTVKDFANLLRSPHLKADWQKSQDVASEMCSMGVGIDSSCLSSLLMSFVQAKKLDSAELLLDSALAAHVARGDSTGAEGADEAVGSQIDVVHFNTLLKGFAIGQKLPKCFELMRKMTSAGIAPTQVSYGILLDACISQNCMDKAMFVFDEMTQQGCTLNTVLYTTLIKGFAKAQAVDKANEVYRQMLHHQVKPDLITFSTLIKANCEEGRMEAALHLLEDMLRMGFVPDEIVFNNLLTGCVAEQNLLLAEKIVGDMRTTKCQPSNVTFSIMLKLYSACGMWERAVETLRTMPAQFGLQPEGRLFSQLIVAAVRARQGKHALEAYRLLITSPLSPVPIARAPRGMGAPNGNNASNSREAVHSTLLQACVSFNMLDTAVQLLEAGVAARQPICPKDASKVLQATQRKRKAQLTEQILRLGLVEA